MALTVDRDSLRKLFKQIDTLVEDASESEPQREKNKDLLLQEFSQFFRVQVEGHNAKSDALWMPQTGADSDWSVSNDMRTVTMSSCAGWRSITSLKPLAEHGDQIYITIKPHALRTLTVGLAPEHPKSFVGDTSLGYSYQSTGHMLNSGAPVESHLCPTFTKGDNIGILLDIKQKYIAFYKNTRMAGVPFTEVDVTGLKLVVSCYMGPCSATINVQGGSDYIKGLKTFPICIDPSA